MTEIYIRDDEIPKNDPHSITRRTIDNINLILSEIIPRPTKTITQKALGFNIVYENEQDANSMFTPEAIRKLKGERLSPSFTFNSQKQREIYILDIPDNIFENTESNITTELEHHNNIDILVLQKFRSEKTNKKYINITLKNEETKKRIATYGKLLLFGLRLPAKEKMEKKQNASAASTTPITQNPNTAHPPFPRPDFSNKPTAQHHGRLLSNFSNWGSNRPATQQTHPQNLSPGLLQTPPGLQPQQIQANASEIESFMCAASNIAVKLQYGLENPEVFCTNFNEILIFNGFNPVGIPDKLINCSKQIFLAKQSENFLNNFRNENTNLFQSRQIPQPNSSSDSAPTNTPSTHTVTSIQCPLPAATPLSPQHPKPLLQTNSPTASSSNLSPSSPSQNDLINILPDLNASSSNQDIPNPTDTPHFPTCQPLDTFSATYRYHSSSRPRVQTSETRTTISISSPIITDTPHHSPQPPPHLPLTDPHPLLARSSSLNDLSSITDNNASSANNENKRVLPTRKAKEDSKLNCRQNGC